MTDVQTTPAADGSLPGVQQAAVLHSPGDVRLEEVPVPTPGPREVLIRVAAVGVCGSDIHYYEHGRIADFVVESPLVLGHEASGVVVAAGAEASLRPGTRVAMEPGVPCGHCRQCRTGRYNLCPDVRFFATPPIDGAFAQYVTLDEAFAHPVPDSLSDEAAALIEPLSVAVWANRKARVEPGMSVLVSGAGPIGLLCAQVAKARGAARIVVTDVSEHRLQVARRLGAHEVVNVRERDPRSVISDADVLLECSGSPQAIDSGIRCVAPAGTVVLVGMGDPTVPVPVDVVQRNELWVTGTFRYAHAYPAAIALAASGAVELDGLVTSHFGLAETEQALRAVRQDPTALKVIVHPNGTKMG